MYIFKNLEAKERIYKYWNHNLSGEAVCYIIDKYFKDKEFEFVELGCQLAGLSDLVLHEFDKSEVVAIDIENCNPEGIKYLQEIGLTDFLFIKGSSLNVYKEFNDNSIDFLYIDTDPHKEDQLKQEILLWFPKVTQNGILAFHDYNHPLHPDVKKVVDEFCKNNNLELMFPNVDQQYYNVYFIKK